MNSDLLRRLGAIADDLQGPLGRIPLDRVFRRHLDLFEELRREGCTWAQLVRALTACGVRRADGGVISVDHLRGTVSRLAKRRIRARSSPAAERQEVRLSKVRKQSKEQEAHPKQTVSQSAPSTPAPPVPKPLESVRTEAKSGVSSAIQARLARVARLRGG